MHDHGVTKFPASRVLHSSDGRGWRRVAAELRSHPAGELPAFLPEHMEITLAVRPGADSTVHRTGDGIRQATRARPGTLWLCPIGVREDAIRITEPIPEVLHVYLPAERFGELSAELPRARVSPRSVDYLAGVDDDLIRQIGYALRSELVAETAGGRLLVESLALALTARLVHSYTGGAGGAGRAEGDRGLDRARLRRVLDFIEAGLEDDLSVEELAAVACLSRFHFARAFRAAAGCPPHQYVSRRRLERAKALLARTERPLAEVALTCRFSSQANFTRAFRRATGVTPGEFRRAAR